MEKNRIEAFSDGVLAIIITIMVLELKQPAGDGISDFLKLGHVLLAYIISYFFIAIYWVNHHLIFSSGQKDQCENIVVQYYLAICHVIYSFCDSMDRFLSAILDPFNILFCSAGFSLHHLSSDVLSDCL